MMQFCSTRPRRLLPAAACALCLLTSPAFSQEKVSSPEPTRAEQDRQFEAARVTRVFHLANVGQVNDANEIMVALRNIMDTRDHIYMLNSTNNIVVSAPPDELTRVAQLISELDSPRPTYRVTYTIAESDSGKRIGVQHFSMVALPGQRVQLKQGDKIPVITSSDQKNQESQFTYLDVGVNLDTTLDSFANGLRVRSKVELSSVGQQHQTGALADEPVVRQSVLEGTSFVLPGKPLILGGIDVAGSTRHIDVEVVAEPLP